MPHFFVCLLHIELYTFKKWVVPLLSQCKFKNVEGYFLKTFNLTKERNCKNLSHSKNTMSQI